MSPLHWTLVIPLLFLFRNELQKIWFLYLILAIWGFFFSFLSYDLWVNRVAGNANYNYIGNGLFLTSIALFLLTFTTSIMSKYKNQYIKDNN